MAFPTTLLNNTSPSGSDLLTSPDHASQHSTVDIDLLAVERKIGLGAGTPTANQLLVGSGNGTAVWGGTVNSLIMGTPAITGGTINNSTLGTPAITGGVINNSAMGTPTITAPVINGAVSGSAIATGAAINTGTSDTTIVTPKAIADSKIVITDKAQALTNKTAITTNLLITPFLNSPTTLANSLNSNLVIPTTSSFVSFAGGGASATIGGIVAGVEGQRVILYNATGLEIDLLGENTSSTATNRIFMGGLLTVTFSNLGAVELIYSVVLGRWILISKD